MPSLIFRLCKLASTKLNYVIGVGAIVFYVDAIIHVFPTVDHDVIGALCNLTPWLLAIGYSLCYGTILAKMTRVYYIFNNPSLKRKVIITMHDYTYRLIHRLAHMHIYVAVTSRKQVFIIQQLLWLIT